MELLRNLFEGYPNLWGGGVAHSVLILSLVIAFGIMLGKIKVAGISLGVTWILFVGIVFGHFNLNLNEHLLHFLKEFGLILFVYSIGLQVGPGFFSAFKKGGFTLNMLAMIVVFAGVIITLALHFITGIPITTMVGILSGAVTNTPGLGAAQQANSDLTGIDAPEIALGYAVAYPLGVVGCIMSLLGLKYLFRINTKQEEAEAEQGLGHLQELTVRPVSLEVRNEALHGKRIKDIRPLVNRNFVVSRIRHLNGKKESELVNSDTELHLGDEILVIATPIDIEAITAFFGKPIEVEWEQLNKELISRRILITKPELNGKTLAQLKIRNNFGASVTRVNRSGVDLVASPQLQLQMGDRVTIVGSELAVSHAEKVLGNSMKRLNHPNLIPIFLTRLNPVDCVQGIKRIVEGNTLGLKYDSDSAPRKLSDILKESWKKYLITTLGPIILVGGVPGAIIITSWLLVSERKKIKIKLFFDAIEKLVDELLDDFLNGKLG